MNVTDESENKDVVIIGSNVVSIKFHGILHWYNENEVDVLLENNMEWLNALLEAKKILSSSTIVNYNNDEEVTKDKVKPVSQDHLFYCPKCNESVTENDFDEIFSYICPGCKKEFEIEEIVCDKCEGDVIFYCPNEDDKKVYFCVHCGKTPE